jgi:uncharacterized membrane protein
MSQSQFPWRTLLFISLALNLLTIGAALGAWGAGVRLERSSGGAMVERLPGPRGFIAAMPPETRAEMRREVMQSWARSRELRRAAAEARREAFAAAAEEPYDAERVRAAFARVRAADQDAVGVFHDNVVEAFGRLTPEQRRAALQSLREAAPARRQSAAPEDMQGAGPETEQAPPPADERTLRERRQQRREAIRERIRERREGQQP